MIDSRLTQISKQQSNHTWCAYEICKCSKLNSTGKRKIFTSKIRNNDKHTQKGTQNKLFDVTHCTHTCTCSHHKPLHVCHSLHVMVSSLPKGTCTHCMVVVFWFYSIGTKGNATLKSIFTNANTIHELWYMYIYKDTNLHCCYMYVSSILGFIYTFCNKCEKIYEENRIELGTTSKTMNTSCWHSTHVHMYM